MDPWQAARYHQPGSVEVVRTGAAAVSTSAVWTGKNGSVAVSRISPAWVGVSQLSHLQRSGLVDMDRWQSAGYHQPGLVGRSCPIFSGLDW